MITIDRISFEFAMDDEPFAHSLYADWNSFCRTCVENILEECLSEYDKERVLHEIETIDLDLGSMPQEDFYSEFPRRLRKELLKALPSLPFAQTDRKERKTVASRFANLLYYLEYGVLKTEWADTGFNLSVELDELTMQDMEKIAGLCLANVYVLRRILLQTDNDEVLVCLYSIAMGRVFSVKNEKRRFMEIFLEMQPDLPMRFVHEVEEDGQLRGMAELLDTRSIRRMMEKEAEEHAEVDLPPYWHYLYEWLIKYYPFNGIAIFGSKNDFIGHLHYRLLTFIHKRNHTFYLSKAELTVSFLLEVFGATYYKEVLNALYNMQPRNADGSPAYDGYYNRELYRIFMQLSLLLLPTSALLDVAVKKDARQTLLLSRTIDLLQRERGRFACLSTMTTPFTTALSEALLLFMQDKDTLGGRNLTEQEVIGKFLAYLYYVYTRRTDYNDNKEWKHLQEEVTNGLGLNDTETVSEDAIAERLKDQRLDNSGLTPEEERMLESSQEKNQEIALIGNAGLSLLSPWFPRLFGMLGYLDEEKRNFKDTASRIRAVFLLQYLVCPEEKEYREPELVFNRLLVALPAQVPLPKQIELTDEEKQTADSLLKGVKDNWTKMSNTSASGFRQSFILRNGQLEQQDEKWQLTVESHAYDMLLETVPWAFRQIRYPWLKKYIQVLWHEKQEF
ncbi:MAG: contractile injection system tape measure protein [Bacteroides sp.]